MSNGGGFYGRTERVRQSPYYDQVASDSPTPSLRDQPANRIARSADPLPPPPLPQQPPVGPAPSDLSDPEHDPDPALDIKPVHRFIPDSWKNFFRGSNRSQPWSMPASSSPPPSSSSCVAAVNNNNNSTSEGVRCSPPHSPSVPGGSYHDAFGGSSGSCNSRKELLELQESESGRTYRTAMTYGERVEEYHQRYAFMKSWSGLLRILGCVELLLGAAVFACVCAYIHKDNEWFNMFGYSSPGAGFYGGAGGAGGYYYSGPKTPFVLVVAGLAWLITVIVLVLGMTMYYRTILLDSNWWPLTEFTINLALAVLYMAAGIVYVRDTTRGGLCSYPVFNNGINGAFCRTEAGQTAAIIFLFVTMTIYLIGAIVCLKMWRHEAARLYREKYGEEMRPSDSRSARPLIIRVPYADPDSRPGPDPVQDSGPVPLKAPQTKSIPPQVLLQGSIPSGHIPKPVIVPDYIAKYPTIRSDEERDQFRAVFNDQYAEYKELHAEVQATLKKFDDMDAMMRSLPQHPNTQMEVDRINKILQDYQRKKNDPTFLEKKERCEYLKSKLSHIKQKIQEYDKVMEWNDGYG